MGGCPTYLKGVRDYNDAPARLHDLDAWQIFSVETMYVGLIVISLLGVVFTFALNEIERFLVPWRTGR